MAEKKLEGKKVAILVTNDFEQVEMTKPRQALDDAGAETYLISPAEGEVQGMNHDVKANRFKVDVPLDEANPADYDALLLPGGALNADELRINPKAQEFARHFDEEGKPIAVICHAPWLLVSANLVRGRTLTSWPTLKDDIRNAGGNWVDQEVVIDNNWVSSRGPKDIPAFNEKAIQLISEGKKARKEAAPAM
ncbi:MAG TPA: type 1 glutamine amidotransferase domain-containing protein [Armatimonadota bacterium]|nr:type 1 glutamine amidotransferase domain-containing protein [Armatimonadota bacterium]HOP79606.1 type 1 glutamine amidotransferase domain-containing protein [Armatimonadota bacterium]HPP74434.1 type 1 glutamine amidotransferase domain-containing protein [Armatimonadota bacterium]